MALRDDRKIVLPYGSPAPKPRRPPRLADVGCASSVVGAIVFGIVLPCAGFNYALRQLDDLGGPLFWPVVMLVGGVAGAAVGPACGLSIYWALWRLSGSP